MKNTDMLMCELNEDDTLAEDLLKALKYHCEQAGLDPDKYVIYVQVIEKGCCE